MNTEDFLKAVRVRTQSPFVFISYSSSVDEIKERVLKLGKFLENMDINVIYDRGGLPPGTDLDEFMMKISDQNCKYVLMVCDHTYKEKTLSLNSGVKIEYKYLLNKINSSNDRDAELGKVFLLLAEEAENVSNIIPMEFNRRIYENFFDDKSTTFNSILELVKDCKKSNLKKNTYKQIKEKSEEKYNIANNSYDIGQYDAALKNINEAINIYKQIKKKDKRIVVKYGNLASVVNIKLGNNKEARIHCLEVLDNIPKGEERLFALCYGNLSMTYVNEDDSLYEKYAKMSLDFSKKAKSDELYYYLTLYVASLFKTQRYEEAYSYQKEALNHIIKSKNLKSVIGIQIYANLAEICIMRAKNKRKHNKIDLLLEGKSYIIQSMDLCKKMKVEREDILYEMYSIAEKVFGELKKYYM